MDRRATCPVTWYRRKKKETKMSTCSDTKVYGVHYSPPDIVASTFMFTIYMYTCLWTYEMLDSVLLVSLLNKKYLIDYTYIVYNLFSHSTVQLLTIQVPACYSVQTFPKDLSHSKITRTLIICVEDKPLLEVWLYTEISSSKRTYFALLSYYH